MHSTKGTEHNAQCTLHSAHTAQCTVHSNVADPDKTLFYYFIFAGTVYLIVIYIASTNIHYPQIKIKICA